uniref:ELM2 domain-containing protein n=1 Tax=Panagrellus redivivus TaxID=6233 RepID=A0A7E4V8R8_PANRE
MTSNGESSGKILTRSKARNGGTNGERVQLTVPKPSLRTRDSTGSSASQMSSKEKKEVRIGDICQVQLTDVEKSYIGENYENYAPDRDVLIWNAGEGLDGTEIDIYLHYAWVNHKIPKDKALYILHVCNNDIQKAKIELHSHINLDDEWTTDDDRVFWYGFQAFGKSFGKIKQLLPHKKMGSIVCHYYATKKKQHYKSLLNDDVGTFDISDDDDENEAEPTETKTNIMYICKNCGASVRETYHVNLLEVCKACKLYFKIANAQRPCIRPLSFEKRVLCPKDMGDIANQFEAMAKVSTRDGAGEDDDIVCIDKPQRTVCDDLLEETARSIERNRFKTNQVNTANNKRNPKTFCDLNRASELLEKISQDRSKSRNTHIWTEFEQIAAFHCLVRFNWDYDAVAEVIGNKTPDMVRAFANENRAAIEKVIKEEDSAMDVEINFEDDTPKQAPEIVTIADD